jgi:hypothetical protein
MPPAPPQYTFPVEPTFMPSGTLVKPGEPGEALPREPLDSVPLRQDRCLWHDRTRGPRMPARWRAAPGSSAASPASAPPEPLARKRPVEIGRGHPRMAVRKAGDADLDD